jgi:hypothetical protein
MINESLDIFMADFATPVTASQGLQNFLFSGIFDEGSDPLMGIGAEGRSIVVFAKTSDVVALHHGASLTVKGKQYEVAGKNPDPDGEFTELELKEDFNLVAPGLNPQLKVAFSYNVANPFEVLLVPSGSTLLTAQIVILQPFNGVGATLSLTDDQGTTLMETTQNNPYEQAEFETNPGKEYSTQSRIRLNIVSGGSTQGRGLILLDLQ